jgi:hypothetical protein
VLEWSEYDPFATTEDFATATKMDLSDVDEATAADALAGVSAEIRRYCRWQIWPVETDDALEVNGTGARELALPVRMLQDATSVVDNGTELDVAAWTWTRFGTLRRVDGGCFSDLDRGIIATVSHGFVNRPDDLRKLAIELATTPFIAATGRVVSRAQAGQVQVQYEAATASPLDIAAITPDSAAGRRLTTYRVRWDR